MDNFTQEQARLALGSNMDTLVEATSAVTVQIPSSGLIHLTLAIVILLTTHLANTLWKKYSFYSFARASRCLPVSEAANPFPMPWSLNRKYEVYRASVRGDLFDGHFSRKYAKYGNTHAIVSPLTRIQKGVNTIEPENIRCVLADRFDDYRRPAWRSLAAQPMLLPGLFTTDGPVWAHWRGMVRPQFARKKIDVNVAESERHVQLSFTGFGAPGEDGWLDDVDLLGHLYRLTMDTSTRFLFGTSAETQTAHLARSGRLPASAPAPAAAHLDGFDDAFSRAAGYVGHRIKLSNMYWLYDGPGFRRACRDSYRMVDAYVSDVRARGDKVSERPDTVIEEMEARGASQKDMVEQAMHLLVAGMDTTAAALAWAFALLAAHPERYARVRDEVVRVFGTEADRRAEFDYETLKGCQYLQWCVLETLRLFPAGPVNVREAVRDTVLPVGGGPDGRSPVAVRKGARVQLGTYLTHRRKDLWGEDADEFRPERWEGRRRGWEFTPFSGGPQVCIGQGYSMTQVSFVIARVAMRYDRMEPSEGSNNMKRKWMTVLTPGAGVWVKLHLAEQEKH